MKLILVILLSFFLLPAYSQVEEKPLSILFIGNSFTFMNNMPKIFKKIATKAGKNVYVQKTALGGASFRVHAQRDDMYEAIKKRKWDYVILQGYSRELTFSNEYIDTATVPFVQQITDSIYLNNPCTNVLLFMTWSYENGFNEREEVDSFDKMTAAIDRGYNYLGEIFNIPVVPIGLVWKDVREKDSTVNLYAEDKAHPSVVGSYLVASTFFGAIFLEGIEDVYTKTIHPKYAGTIKKSMYSIVTELADSNHLGFNRFLLDYHTTVKGSFELTFFSNYEKGIVKWNFGDGTYSSKESGTHKYRKPGKYNVVLTVDSACGSRQISREVVVKKLKKPKRKPNSNPKVRKSTKRRD